MYCFFEIVGADREGVGRAWGLNFPLPIPWTLGAGCIKATIILSGSTVCWAFILTSISAKLVQMQVGCAPDVGVSEGLGVSQKLSLGEE